MNNIEELMRAEERIDEFELSIMNVLKTCDDYSINIAVAFCCSIVHAVADKYNIKASDFAFKMVNTIVKSDLQELEEKLHNVN